MTKESTARSNEVKVKVQGNYISLDLDKHFDKIFIEAAQKIAPVLLGKSNTNSEYLNDGMFCAKTKKPKASSQVYCIDGKWGSGKSSLKSYIEQEFKKQNCAERPYIIEYSAWEWQEQGADLRLSFFDELGKQLKQEVARLKFESNRKREYLTHCIEQMALKLDAYKNKLNPQPDHNLFATIKDSAELLTFIIAIVGFAIGVKEIKSWDEFLKLPLMLHIILLALVVRILYSFGCYLYFWVDNHNKKTYAALSLQELKKEIQKDIAELTKINHKEEKHQKIIVFLDDLDRLNQEQIADVMQLVKANSDFEHMVFVLLMDKAHVEKQLNELYHTENFLEKIVQYTFKVPSYERDSLFAFYSFATQSMERTGIDDELIQRIFQSIVKIHPTFRSVKLLQRDFLASKDFYRTNNFSDINLVDLLIARTLYFYHPNLLDIMMQNLLNKYPPQKDWDELFKKLINNKNDCKNHEPSLKTLYDCLQLDKPYAFKEKIAGYSSEENIFYYDIYQQFWLPNPLPLGDVESFLKQVESADFANFQDYQNNEELIQYFESKELPQSILNFLKIKNYIGSLTVLIKLLFERIESWSNNAVGVDETTPMYKARRNIVVFHKNIQVALLKFVCNIFEENSENSIFSHCKDVNFYNLDTLHTDTNNENFTNQLKEHIDFSCVAQLFDDSADSQNRNQAFYDAFNNEQLAKELLKIGIKFHEEPQDQKDSGFPNTIKVYVGEKCIFNIKKTQDNSKKFEKLFKDLHKKMSEIALEKVNRSNFTSSIIENFATSITLNDWSDLFNLPQEQQLPVLYFLWYLTKYAKDNNWQT